MGFRDAAAAAALLYLVLGLLSATTRALSLFDTAAAAAPALVNPPLARSKNDERPAAEAGRLPPSADQPGLSALVDDASDPRGGAEGASSSSAGNAEEPLLSVVPVAMPAGEGDLSIVISTIDGGVQTLDAWTGQAKVRSGHFVLLDWPQTVSCTHSEPVS